jgi:hypothetical protein
VNKLGDIGVFKINIFKFKAADLVLVDLQFFPQKHNPGQ